MTTRMSYRVAEGFPFFPWIRFSLINNFPWRAQIWIAAAMRLKPNKIERSYHHQHQRRHHQERGEGGGGGVRVDVRRRKWERWRRLWRKTTTTTAPATTTTALRCCCTLAYVSPWTRVRSKIHTHTHTRTHTHGYTHTHAHAHTHIRTCVHSHAQVCTRIFAWHVVDHESRPQTLEENGMCAQYLLTHCPGDTHCTVATILISNPFLLYYLFAYLTPSHLTILPRTLIYPSIPSSITLLTLPLFFILFLGNYVYLLLLLNILHLAHIVKYLHFLSFLL